VGALWHGGSGWFQTGERNAQAKKRRTRPALHDQRRTKGFDVMVSGEARRVTDPTSVAEIAALWAKSGWPAQPDDSGTGITAPFNAPTLGPPRGRLRKSSRAPDRSLDRRGHAGSTRWWF